MTVRDQLILQPIKKNKQLDTKMIDRQLLKLQETKTRKLGTIVTQITNKHRPRNCQGQLITEGEQLTLQQTKKSKHQSTQTRSRWCRKKKCLN